MSTLEWLDGDKSLTLVLPKKVDKNFARELLINLHEVDFSKDLILDFKNTDIINRGFYPIIHQLTQKLSEKSKGLSSINMSYDVKSQANSDGVFRVFNHVGEFRKSKPLHSPNRQKTECKKIQVEFISPFINSTIEILKVQANTEAKALKPILKAQGDSSPFDVVGIINLVSDAFDGKIALCFSQEVFLKIYANMLDEVHEEINEEVVDAASELLNIIFGMAKAELNDNKEYQIKKAIPEIIRGPGEFIKETKSPTLILPFESSAGQFSIEIELAA